MDGQNIREMSVGGESKEVVPCALILDVNYTCLKSLYHIAQTPPSSK